MIVGIILQTAAQNIAMLVLRSAIQGIAGGVYLSETFPSRWRSWGVGLLKRLLLYWCANCGSRNARHKYLGLYLGLALSFTDPSVWAVLCMATLPLLPESPRWLVYKGYYEEARIVVAQTNADGDPSYPVVLAVYKEIVDTLNWEKHGGRTMSLKEIFKSHVARKRLLIGASAGPFSCIAGNIIASYYLGDELTTAGITDSNDQLKDNVVLNAWCLFCALLGTHLITCWANAKTFTASVMRCWRH